METRRYLIFFCLSMGIMLSWIVIGPKVFPGIFAQQQQAQKKKNDAGNENKRNKKKKNNDEKIAAKDGEKQPVEIGPDNKEPEKKQPNQSLEFEDHPFNPNIVLGSAELESGYFERFRLTTVGASVIGIELNDPRYGVLRNPNPDPPRPQLNVVGDNLDVLATAFLKKYDKNRDGKVTKTEVPALVEKYFAQLDVNDDDSIADNELRSLSALPLQKTNGLLTFQMAVPSVDEQFVEANPLANLARVNWKVDEKATLTDADNPKIIRSVTFTIKSPDGKLEIRKRYEVKKVALPKDVDDDELNDAWIALRDTKPEGYQLLCKLTFRNLDPNEERSITYELQGPVGLPLENRKNTRKYRDIKVAFVNVDDGELDPESIDASSLVKQVDENEGPEWQSPFKYIGVDSQFFTCIVLPKKDQRREPYFSYSRPMLVRVDAEESEYSDISIALSSKEILLEPNGEYTHEFTIFAGPKRSQLLKPIGAESSLDFSTWFGIGYISRAMVSILTFIHSIPIPFIGHIPYGIAIIMLTIMVRGCMYPISCKQAKGAKKMKELQPKIAELKKKYANDKEKMARAQMELFGKHNYNPMSGCLPMFLQLPIFIGLYQGLNNSVNLRLAPFLWFDNLAAPDALFNMPAIPFLGWDEFNLLPLVTITLFFIQQKMFMPPPTDDQTAMQQKMMKYMMIFMGFMFYKVPSGLCVYFIASSLWGLGERKLLDYGKPAEPVPNDESNAKTKKKSLWTRLSSQLESAANARDGNGDHKQSDSSEPSKELGILGRLREKIDAAGQSHGQQQTTKKAAEKSQSRSSSSKRKKKKRGKGSRSGR